MLHVERAVHLDTGIEQFGDVLPAPLVATAGQVAMGQLVDQQHRGLARQRGIQVKLGEVALAAVRQLVTYGPPRQHFQAFDQRRRLGATVRLHQAHDDIDALPLQFARGRQHGVGLAHAGRGAEENLQAPMALVQHGIEQRIGARFAGGLGHARSLRDGMRYVSASTTRGVVISHSKLRSAPAQWDTAPAIELG